MFCTIYTLLSDKLFATPGRRNNDAVNICILLYSYGFSDSDDPTEEFGIYRVVERLLVEDFKMNRTQVEAFMEHVERVLPYLKDWYDSGHITDYMVY